MTRVHGLGGWKDRGRVGRTLRIGDDGGIKQMLMEDTARHVWEGRIECSGCIPGVNRRKGGRARTSWIGHGGAHRADDKDSGLERRRRW